VRLDFFGSGYAREKMRKTKHFRFQNQSVKPPKPTYKGAPHFLKYYGLSTLKIVN